ncbi:MAG: sigma-E processing peptidase SpoIIGA [Oscillospiraceae bacterium]|nr:sigma-E processing peptidase SpoIIGA [Oscillospiraceae bacterium]
MIIYIDVLIIVNFVITYFTLISAAIVSGYTYSRSRVVVSSAIGAFFCLYIFVQSNSFFVDTAVKVTSLLLCSLMAYWQGKIKGYFIQTVCFAGLNIMVTGAVMALSVKSRMIYSNNMFYYMDINPLILVTASVFIYAAAVGFSALKEQFSADKMYMMNVEFKDFSLENINAFYDSGLKIKDIVSNKDVLLISFENVRDKLPEKLNTDIYKFLKEEYTDIKTNFVPVFFNTISGDGMMPALKAEKIKLEQKEIRNILVAFVDNGFGENITAIFGTDIKKQI